LGSILAHWFKIENQKMYGAVEVAFGAVSAWTMHLVFQQNASPFAQYASLLGGAYVVARGLNNIKDANARAELLVQEEVG
jgi:hypothetical protein